MKFIQITDLHMVPAGETLYGLDPAERLGACVADINAQHGDAAFAIVTGDLAHVGDAEAYARLRQLLSPLAMPCHLLIGNHDRRTTFRESFPDAAVDDEGFVQFTVETPAGVVIALDTNEPGHHHGVLCAARLRWLGEAIARAGDRAIHLFMHHPPFAVGIKRMDRIALQDSDAFAAVVCGRPNIRHLYFGHLHRPMGGSWRGIPFTNIPGINHQVALDFVLEDKVPGSHEPPVYGVVFATPDTTIVHMRQFLDRTATFNL